MIIKLTLRIGQRGGGTEVDTLISSGYKNCPYSITKKSHSFRFTFIGNGLYSLFRNSYAL